VSAAKPASDRIDALHERLDRDARNGGYQLNPDIPFTRALVEGLLVNQDRYGYQACPCRLAAGARNEDLDIICPCDYRDPDLAEYGACYCGLYVSGAVARGEQKLRSIPERRGTERKDEGVGGSISATLKYPVWRCSVCGYICARETPPEICPICKVSKDRFERFI
jgi:ferredoxin-thioredoxin reductase catalytic chain